MEVLWHPYDHYSPKQYVNRMFRGKKKYKCFGAYDEKGFKFIFKVVFSRYDVDSKSPDLSKHVSNTTIAWQQVL